MKDLTEDEWRFVEWLDIEIRKAENYESSILTEQLSYLRNDPMFIHPNETLLHPPFSCADALALGILELVHDQGVEKTISAFKITIPRDNDYLKDLLLKLPFHHCKFLHDYSKTH